MACQAAPGNTGAPSCIPSPMFAAPVSHGRRFRHASPRDRVLILMPPRRTADGRIPSLDGWRAAAIALVLLSHEWQASSSPVNFGRWSSLFLQGDLGVRVFFVLS